MAVEQLCTAADVTNMPWPLFATLPSARQDSLINTASQKIINHCRRPGFIQASVDELKDGGNQPVLWLNMRPVITVVQVTVNGEVIDNSDGLAWTVNTKTGKLIRGHSYGTLPGQGDPRFQRWWPVGTQNIEVQYWAGYVTVPDPIVEATCFLAKFMYERAKVSGIFASESLGDYSYSLNLALQKMTIPEYVADLCAEYVQDDGPL